MRSRQLVGTACFGAWHLLTVLGCAACSCLSERVSGAQLPRVKLAILHGCVFEEMCEKCGALYFRDKEVNTISFQPTGNVCEKKECGGVCRDTLLDWEDPLPENQLCPSEEECKAADLIVTLGTSLRIEPAASLPLLCKEEEQGEPRRKSAHRRIVIINLQETPKDSASDMLLRAKVDMVMERVCTSMLVPKIGLSSQLSDILW